MTCGRGRRTRGAGAGAAGLGVVVSVVVLMELYSAASAGRSAFSVISVLPATFAR
jgi:hypothetical protein